jgi:hypothetical protein
MVRLANFSMPNEQQYAMLRQFFRHYLMSRTIVEARAVVH